MSANSATQSVEAAIKNRLESPVVGTVLLSFILTNWQIFILLTAGENCAQCRIDAVAAYWTRTSFFISVGVPVLISGFYLGVLPFILEWYENFPRLLRLKKDIKDKIAETDASEVVRYKKSLADFLLIMKNAQESSLERATSVKRMANTSNTSRAIEELDRHIDELQKNVLAFQQLDLSHIIKTSQSNALAQTSSALSKIVSVLYPSKAKPSE